MKKGSTFTLTGPVERFVHETRVRSERLTIYGCAGDIQGVVGSGEDRVVLWSRGKPWKCVLSVAVTKAYSPSVKGAK
jgi:hypothetical protein